MAQPFRFPPPPPPPPPSSIQHTQSANPLGHVGGNRYNSFVSRGQGSYRANGRGRGGFGGQQYNSGVSGSFGGTNHHESRAHYGQGGNSHGRGQKRDYTTAFRGRSGSNIARHAQSPVAHTTSKLGVDAKIVNASMPPAAEKISLGLVSNTRSTDEMQDEDDERDEEAELAPQVHIPDGLQFEHRGQTLNLRTAEEIAAWIAERRQKWPTEQKRAIAQQEAEERRQKLQAERAVRLEAARAAATARQEERNKQRVEQEKKKVRQKMLQEQIAKAKTSRVEVVEPLEAQRTAAETKIERLRKKAAKIAAQLRQIEVTAPTESQTLTAYGDTVAKPGDDELEKMLVQVDAAAMRQNERTASARYGGHANEHVVSSEISPSDDDPLDDTSSSGSSSSSESDSDAPPEVSSSKAHKIDKITRSARAPVDTTVPDNRPVCRNFLRYGKCKYRRQCHFKHEIPDAAVSKRKGLYEALVDKEVEEEHRKALRLIISLGDRGLLQDPP